VIATYVPDLPVVDGYLTGGNSDHASFWAAGFPAIFFFEDSIDRSPYIHTSQDRIGISLNDYAFMHRNVQAAVSLLATLARPVRVRIEHTPMGNPPAGGTGYEIAAQVRSNAPLREDSIGVHYRIDGGRLHWRVMTRPDPAGRPHTYATVIPRQRAGHLVEYAIQAADIEGRTSYDPYRFPQELHSFVVDLETLLADSFDEDHDWVVGAPEDSARTGVWIRASPIGTGGQPYTDADGDSSGACLVTGNATPEAEEGTADVDGGRTSVTSPAIGLAGLARIGLEYDVWFVDETFHDDSLTVLLSGDDGESWVRLFRFGEGMRSWRKMRHPNLEQHVTPTERTRIRFVAEDVGQPSLVEVAIDNVKVTGVHPEPEPPPSSFSRIVQAYPVPFRGEVIFLYDLLRDGEARVDIYDVQGRWINGIDELERIEGRYEMVWDGRDREGRRVPGGAYFLRFRMPGERESALSVLRVP